MSGEPDRVQPDGPGAEALVPAERDEFGPAARTRVKICGLTRPADVELACGLGADAVGVVFAPSPRRVELDAAVDVLAAAGVFVCRVGVFADQDLDLVEEAVSRCGLDWVQLCGAEPADFARAVPARVLRVVHVRGPGEPRSAADYPADAFLLDSPPAEGRRGGTGRTFDWAGAAPGGRLPWPRGRVVLAGGLTAENVGSAIAAIRPGAVDVSSGVESSPGVKDAQRLAAFIAAVRRADVELAEHAKSIGHAE